MEGEAGEARAAEFPAEEFRARRARVLEAIGSQAVVLLRGAVPTGGFDVFRQSNDFYYLCGVEVPHAYLLLDGRNGRTTVFLPARDPGHERSEGPGPSSDDAQLVLDASGADEVCHTAELSAALSQPPAIFLPSSPSEGCRMSRDTLLKNQAAIDADPWDRRPTAEAHFAARVSAECPGAEIHDLTPILDPLRVVKSRREIAVLRRAGRLSALAITEAMRSTRPGVMEYELGAAAEYLFLLHGARGGGYRPIIAGGANAWYAHYFRNDAPLRDGDLVLMDYAPDVAYYTSDIGRMWPVNGRYSAWQRELYGFVVTYHGTILEQIRPGATAAQVLEESAAKMAKVVEGTHFSSPCHEEAARRMLAFPGHLSHGVGMSVHDVGDYQMGALLPGQVFAVDPQMWVPEERLYVRVEDTVVVTTDGVEVLTPGAALDLDDVERVMTEVGLLQVAPPRQLNSGELHEESRQ